MNKTVILTGLRANNDLHIGNYFGGLLPITKMAKDHADEYQINLFVPDLHSFTTPVNHGQLQAQIMNNIRLFVAAGLPIEHPNVHIYRQSYIPAHSELAWILDCFTGMGEMGRMTQFKDKSSKLSEDRISVGLFNYPVLMAADILLYNTTYVPVGEDQTQHIEFTRDIAERMNRQFNQEIFTVPAPVSKQHEFFGNEKGLRIKDLSDPSIKMSKSDESGKGILFLSDDVGVARKKVMSATTDTVGAVHYDITNQSGISNLIDILALLQGREVNEVASKYEGQESYGTFKAVVADEVERFLTEFQNSYNQLDEELIVQKLKDSEASMNITANETLLRVQKAVGLR